MEKSSIQTRSPSDLISEIKRLQAARQSHLDALHAIDEILSGVAQTLTSLGPDMAVRREIVESPSGPALGVSRDPLMTADFPAGVLGIVRRRYHRLPQTGEDFVLSFVREHGAPTTLQINNAWRAQGRGGAANNVIGRLLKQGLLIREPLGERRGSRYRLSGTPAEGSGAT
jgi:hypothetical protein